jgi:hypothetical protein
MKMSSQHFVSCLHITVNNSIIISLERRKASSVIYEQNDFASKRNFWTQDFGFCIQILDFVKNLKIFNDFLSKQ